MANLGLGLIAAAITSRLGDEMATDGTSLGRPGQ
jgi:hypothetical protein